jgi:hypothetical protein
MIIKKKLVLLESEMQAPNGHFLDYLIESTIYFQDKFNIIWFLNKNCDLKESFIPKNVEINKIIISNYYRRNNNKLFYFFEETFFFFKNFYDILYFTILFIKKKKFLIFFKTLFSNFFIIPRYFKSFYFGVLNSNLNENDHILVQSCRRKDISCIYFFSNIEKVFPKIHLRVFYPPKKRFKSFYFYLSKIENFMKENKIFLYTEHGYKEELIKNEINNKYLVNTVTPIFSFCERFHTNSTVTIGFVGQARKDKGFHLFPELILKLEKKKINLNYLIQFTSVNKDTEIYKNQLLSIAKDNSRVKIINKYLDFKEYRNILSQIDIMPMLYDVKHLTMGNSGVIYSCITHEVSLIIPNDCSHLKKFLIFKSYEEARDLDDYAEKIIFMKNNFSLYLSEAKKLSLDLKNTIKNSSLVRNIV